MTITATHLKIATAGAVLLVASVVAASYAHSLITAASNEATQKTEAKYQKILAAQNAAFEKRVADRDQQTKTQLQAMQDIVAKIKTPQQHAEFDQRQLADAIKGIQFQIQPSGEMTAIIPKESVPQATAAIEACKECEVKLAANQANLADREAQMKLADQQIQSLKTQRDAALTAAKGGNWVKRLGKQLKVIGCAGAGAGIGGTRGAKEAAIGAVGGAVVCSLF